MMDFLNNIDWVKIAAVIIPLIGSWIAHKQNQRARWEKIQVIATDVWHTVELIGHSQGWLGENKWARFVLQFMSEMDTNRLGDASRSEMSMVKTLVDSLSKQDKVSRLNGVRKEPTKEYTVADFTKSTNTILKRADKALKRLDDLDLMDKYLRGEIKPPKK